VVDNHKQEHKKDHQPKPNRMLTYRGVNYLCISLQRRMKHSYRLHQSLSAPRVESYKERSKAGLVRSYRESASVGLVRSYRESASVG